MLRAESNNSKTAEPRVICDTDGKRTLKYSYLRSNPHVRKRGTGNIATFNITLKKYVNQA